MGERLISIAIPTWQRAEMTIESFLDVHYDGRVSEIVIVDDASDMEVYEDLKSMTDALPKVKLYRNESNIDCYFNKHKALSYCTNDWAILLDSDNKIDSSYIDRIFELSWEDWIIYTPCFAQPVFDFRAYEGLTISKHNVIQYVDKPLFETMLNAANYFVNKNNYQLVWTDKIDPVTSDSIFIASKWLNMNGEIFVVPNLYYEHRMHEQSHYRTNVSRTPEGFHESILNYLRALK